MCNLSPDNAISQSVLLKTALFKQLVRLPLIRFEKALKFNFKEVQGAGVEPA